MDPRAHIECLRLESERFGRAARGPFDTPVPSCPDWSLGDLVWHLCGVQWFWAEVVRTGVLDRETIDLEGIGRADDRPDDELATWFDDVSAGLLGVLEATDPATRVWSWDGGQQDVAWVARRQAQEAAVHRWDAQRAIGEPEPIAPDLAADGIDEFFDTFFEPQEALEGRATVGLAPDDGERQWVVTVDDGRVELGRDMTRADVTCRGSTSALLLLLWRRVAPDAVQVEGDRSALDRLLVLSDLT